MTMAMQRANPMRMTPCMSAGLSNSRRMARKNMSSGPMTQFWSSESPRIRQLRKTSPNSSYRTLANGGYIIRIRPIAMGMEVVPTEASWIARPICGHRYPAPTPTAMARKIQTVR